MTLVAYGYLANVILECIVLVLSVKNRRKLSLQMGEILFNIKSNMADRITTAIFIVLPFIYLCHAFYKAFINKGTLAEHLLGGLFGAIWIALTWLASGRKCKLTEKGLVYFGSFFAWEDILAWKWSSFDKTLIIKVKEMKRKKSISVLELNIDIESLEKVNVIMIKYKGEPNLTHK